MTNDRPLSLLRQVEAELTAQRKRARAAATERRFYREAISADKRAKALALRQAGETYAAIGRSLGICHARARQITQNAARLARDPHWYDPLPMRAQNFLILNGFAGLPEAEAACAIARLTWRELMGFPNFGRGAIGAIEAWLANHRFTLKEEPEPGGQSQLGEGNYDAHAQYPRAALQAR
jgi:hypothetical protein